MPFPHLKTSPKLSLDCLHTILLENRTATAANGIACALGLWILPTQLFGILTSVIRIWLPHAFIIRRLDHSPFMIGPCTLSRVLSMRRDASSWL
jgi:hypothetical protein